MKCINSVQVTLRQMQFSNKRQQNSRIKRHLLSEFCNFYSDEKHLVITLASNIFFMLISLFDLYTLQGL